MSSWEVRFTEKIDRSEGTKSFRFERPSDYNYLAGQFFIVSIPKEDGGSLVHHFTISSSPTEPFLEFTTRIRDSEFKKRLDALPIGTKVTIRPPQGAFTLGEDMEKVAYICGGIGITTARSAIRWAYETSAEIDIVLLYGNRNLEGITFKDELDSLEGERLRVVHILSRPAEDWKGLKGHIDASIISEQLKDWKQRIFFVSGPPAMVEAVKKELEDGVGVSPDRINTENYVGY